MIKTKVNTQQDNDDMWSTDDDEYESDDQSDAEAMEPEFS